MLLLYIERHFWRVSYWFNYEFFVTGKNISQKQSVIWVLRELIMLVILFKIGYSKGVYEVLLIN